MSIFGISTNYAAKRAVLGSCGGTTGNMVCNKKTLMATATPSNYVNSILAQFNSTTGMYGYRLSMVSSIPSNITNVSVTITDAYQNVYTWNNAIVSMGYILLTTSADSVSAYGPGQPPLIMDTTNNSIYSGSYTVNIPNYSTTGATFSFGPALNGSQTITFVANY